MKKVNEKGETLEQFLQNYDPSNYDQCSQTVDMVLMTTIDYELKLLLIERANHPFIGDWALPGGFVNIDETFEEAVLRELREETNINKYTYFRQLYTFASVDRDPRTRIISTAYLSLTPASNIKNTKAGDDAKSARWFTVSKSLINQSDYARSSYLRLEDEENGMLIVYKIQDEVNYNYVKTSSELMKESNAKLAADHIKAINMAVDLVQHRCISSGILFNLLPEECTLREIQNVYESIIGKKIDTANFRRDIKKMLIETGNKKIVGGKQVALYRFNPLYGYLEENI